MRAVYRHGPRVVSWLLVAMVAMACWGPPAGAANYQDPAYLAAVADARVALPSELSYDLNPIVYYNTAVTWEGTPGSSRVKMAAYTKNYYDNYVGQSYPMTYGSTYDALWVFPADDLRNYIDLVGAPATALRIEQVLGLPPDSGYTRIVEFWVDPSDLYRPAPDPEITDKEALLAFPSSQEITISQAYQDWFNARQDTIYTSQYPYPWTRMGYTYDWGRTDSHVGLSEYVIRHAAVVGVAAVHKTLDDYFRDPR